ncbi:hypothetical protein GCM10009757_28000 [Streptomyces cheonanensis]|uniref:Uncharacterized protein n=1 Tax=Streptomyces cheonanensis TaxID=312720 RepID=A0ABP5GS52_9ACTN|nr:hypothetical protein [Streptomyces harbinensis]QKV67324.1 hypothetical protein HUT13_15390 [Streptomyces harbinensis]
MRSFIGTHEVLDTDDFVELALGTDPELWLGVEGEIAEERAARLDAARDILADDPELITHVAVVTIGAVEEFAHRQLTSRRGRTAVTQ